MNHDENALYSLRESYDTLFKTCYESYSDLVAIAEDRLTRNERIEENDEYLVTRMGL